MGHPGAHPACLCSPGPGSISLPSLQTQVVEDWAAASWVPRGPGDTSVGACLGQDGRRCPLRTRPPSWSCFPLLPRWLSGKQSACSAERQVQSLGWENPLERAVATTPVFLPGKVHRQRSPAGYSLQGHKELDTTERRTLSVFFKSSGQLYGHLPSGHLLFACPLPPPAAPSPSQSMVGADGGAWHCPHGLPVPTPAISLGHMLGPGPCPSCPRASHGQTLLATLLLWPWKSSGSGQPMPRSTALCPAPPTPQPCSSLGNPLRCCLSIVGLNGACFLRCLDDLVLFFFFFLLLLL